MDKENANLDTKPVDSASHRSSRVDEVEVAKRTSTTEYNSSQLIHNVEVNADSEVLEEPPEPQPRRSFTEYNEQNENKQESRRSTLRESKDEEDLMASVFGAVNLPEVSYVNVQPTSTLDSNDHDHAIQHIDDALAGEEAYHSEDHTPVMTTRSATRSISSQNRASASDAFDQVAETLMQTAMNDLRLALQDGYSDHYGDEPVKLRQNGDYGEFHPPSEKHLSFGSPPVASRRVSHADRLRTMTYDSIVSTAESRVGAFDVHNEDGTYTAEEINLHHNEVAYVRPEAGETSSITETPEYKIYTSGTGETIRLRRLNEEVAQARNRQYELAALVERERREVERLRNLKQQRLAREAAARVHPSATATAKVQPTAKFQPAPVVVKAAQPAQRPFAARAPGRVGPARSISSNTTDRRSHDSSGTIESIYDEEPAKISPVAQRILNKGKVVATIGNISMVVPEMVMVKGLSATATINRIIVGGEQDPTDEDKTILLFGPIGSGKTTTINSMVNYLYDVKRENNFRFVLYENIRPTKTTKLTSYVFHNTVLPFSVTVVDTPGIPRSNSDLVSGLVKKWFEEDLREAGTFRLDAISIVLKSDERNLGWPFINELAAVKHMLGDDLKTNVLPIITNAEVLSFKASVPKKVLPQPLAVRSLALANITFVEYYKLNNIGFVPITNDIPKLQHNLFFSHGMASLEAYFRDLQELIHPLLAVLRGTRLVKTHSSSTGYRPKSLY